MAKYKLTSLKIEVISSGWPVQELRSAITQCRRDRLGPTLGRQEACRKALEHSRRAKPLRRAATVSLCHSMPTVAVAQSSWIVLVPSCMLHGDREPVPSDPIGVEWHKLTVAHGCSSGPIWAHFGSLRKIFSTLWADIEGPRVQNFIKNMIFERFRKCRFGFKKYCKKYIENSWRKIKFHLFIFREKIKS